MTWDGPAKLIMQATLARYLEGFDVLVEFKQSSFMSQGDNKLVEPLKGNSPEQAVEAVYNIAKQIINVAGRNGYVVTLTPFQFGPSGLTTTVTNFEELT